MQNSVLNYLGESAKKYADKVVYSSENEQVTFGELKKLTDRIGSYFIDIAACRQPIAVYMSKSCACLVACLGVASSRNFYCPLDTEMPSERAEIILKELQPVMVIIDDEMCMQDKAFLKTIFCYPI